MKIASRFIPAVLLLALNSCYFNSTGHIFDAASHNAAIKLSDVQVGQTVYSNGTDYYTYLPRYRYDTEVVTQYSAGGLRDSDGRKVLTNEQNQQFVKISPDLANYMRGVGSTPPVGIVDAADESIKDTCTTTFSATRSIPDSTLREYRYRSSSAPWLYTAGVFNWLCVDLPITCVENSLAIPCVLLTGQTPSELVAGNNLRVAARNGDAAEVRRLLAEGCDINLRDADGWTPLMYAANRGQLHICELLVNNGANIHAVTKPGEVVDQYSSNALHWAAYRGNTACCLYLIEQGIDRNATNSLGDSALDLAIQEGQYSCAEALRAVGCVRTRRFGSSSSGYSGGGGYSGSSYSSDSLYDYEAAQRERDRMMENQAVWQREKDEAQAAREQSF